MGTPTLLADLPWPSHPPAPLYVVGSPCRRPSPRESHALAYAPSPASNEHTQWLSNTFSPAITAEMKIHTWTFFQKRFTAPCGRFNPPGFIFIIILKIHLFIYFWLCWVFVAARGLSLVGASGGYSSLWCTGFSLQWLLLLRSTGSGRLGFSSCGSWTQ